MRVCAGRPGQRTHRLDPLASTAGRPQLPAPWQPRVFFLWGGLARGRPSLLTGFVSCVPSSPIIVGEPRLTTPVSCALLGELGRCVGGRTPSSSGQLTCVTVFLAGTRGSAAGAVGAAEALRGCAGAPATTPSPVPPSTWRPPTWRTLYLRRRAALLFAVPRQDAVDVVYVDRVPGAIRPHRLRPHGRARHRRNVWTLCEVRGWRRLIPTGPTA